MYSSKLTLWKKRPVQRRRQENVLMRPKTRLNRQGWQQQKARITDKNCADLTSINEYYLQVPRFSGIAVVSHDNLTQVFKGWSKKLDNKFLSPLVSVISSSQSLLSLVWKGNFLWVRQNLNPLNAAEMIISNYSPRNGKLTMWSKRDNFSLFKNLFFNYKIEHLAENNK